MISRVTTSKEISDFLQDQFKRREQVIINGLAYVGEQCVNHARDLDTYKDQTGNLRSSTGWTIIKDRKALRTSSFPQVKNGAKGVKEGKDFAKSFSNLKGLNLVVVAGMDYAFHVESKYHLDVLKSSEMIAQREVPRMLKDLL